MSGFDTRRTFIAGGLAGVAGWPLARAQGGSAAAPVPYDLGRQPHLFLDDVLIGETRKIRRRVQNPVRHPANPVLASEHPWESLRVQACGGVDFDEARKRFRMWYIPYGPAWKPSRTAYAESPDGVHWEKPRIGLPGLGGEGASNVILAPEGGTNGIGVFRDVHERDAGRRFKALFDTYTSTARVQKAMFSSDGVHWNPPEGILVMKGKKDSAISVFWSERLGKYMAYVRGFDPAPKPPLPPLGVFRLRTNAYCESPDFLNWTKPVSVIRTDEMDGPGGTVQVYGMSVMPYGDVFVGLVYLLHIQELVLERHPSGVKWDGAPPETPLEIGYMDVQLAVSRDGRNWSRVGNREVFLPRGRPGDWDDEGGNTLQNWVLHDDKLFLYYSGTSYSHATGSPGSIGLATLPADRFLAVEPLFSKEAGILETVPLTCREGSLLVNASFDRGQLQVEALDREGRPAEGFAAGNCVLRRHDDLRYEVRWRTPSGEAALRDLVTRSATFRLRFVLNGDAQLFAFQVGVQARA